MSKRRLTVDQWVQQTISEVIDGKACSAIALLHLKGLGGATEEVVTKALEGNVNVKEMSDHLIGRAEGFSQDIPGIQTFKLVAFYGSNEPHNPFHFTTSDGNIVSRSEAMQSSHEPTPAGLLGQLMKHLEIKDLRLHEAHSSMMQMAQGVMGMCFGPNGAIPMSIKAQLDAIEVVKDSTLDMFERREALVTKQHTAAQELQTRKAIIDLFPNMVNRLTGREVFDEKATRAAMFEEMALKLTPDNVKMLISIGMCTQEQAVALMAQVTAIRQEKQKELDAMKKVPTEEGKNGQLTVPQQGQGNGL